MQVYIDDREKQSRQMKAQIKLRRTRPRGNRHITQSKNTNTKTKPEKMEVTIPMTRKIIYMYELCDPECNECIEACTNNCLKKDLTYKILLLSKPDDCEWCESCYMVCSNGALNLQYIDDGLDRTIMEE